MPGIKGEEYTGRIMSMPVLAALTRIKASPFGKANEHKVAFLLFHDIRR
ncbi:hypothetical protein [Escherichia coli]